MSQIAGYLKIHPDIVIEYCEAYLQKRKQRQEAVKAKAVKAEMTKRFFPAKSEEEALKSILDREFIGIYPWEYTGLRLTDSVESMLTSAKAAKMNDGEVFISIELWSSIQ